MKLPVVSGAELVRAFRKPGYELDEQHGSHMILRRTDPPHRRLSVPDRRELASQLAKGTLHVLIRESGLIVEEFIELL
jgi:predicted RNA binding protein YcfA (HicA-like mRNA interferase family)